MEKSCETPELNDELKDEELPPLSECPQVMTEPSSLRAAKALSVEKIFETPELNDELTVEELPPLLESPQEITEPLLLRAAKAPPVE